MSNINTTDFHDFKQLYDKDPYLKSVETTVNFSKKLAKEDASGANYVINTKETIFYPEGGGQPGDTGVFILEDGSEIKVLDTRYGFIEDDDTPYILHYTNKPLDANTKIVEKINWKRRFTHMQQHSTEHILSGLVYKKYDYLNVGFHLGREYTTIDFSGPVSYEQMQEIVRAANQLIYKNTKVTAKVFTPEEAQDIKYRSKVEIDNLIRLVKIEGADICACCGTHVKHTGEIGLIICTDVESYKGGSRITFYAGTRAFNYIRKQQEILNNLVTHLSSPQEELDKAVSNLESNISDLETTIESTANYLWDKKISELDSSSLIYIKAKVFTPKIVKRLFKTLDADLDKSLLVLMDQKENFTFYLFEPEEEYKSDTGIFKQLQADYAARGGGSYTMTQGQIPAKENGFDEDSKKEFIAKLAADFNLETHQL